MTAGINVYSTLSKVRTYLSLGTADVSDDVEVHQFLINASRAIDKFTRRTFVPRRKTLYFDLHHTDEVHMRNYDVLEVKGLSHINGASEIDAAAYNLKCGNDYNRTPYDRIELLTNVGSVLSFSSTTQKAIHVDVVLGYHEDGANAWIDSAASLTADLGASVLSASVSGSAGANVLGLVPRFSTDQIWRLSGGTDSEEYVQVSDTHTSAVDSGSYIKLVRGINGTAPASHASGTTIEVFDIEPDIEYVARQLTAWQYEQARSPFTNRTIIPTLGVVEMPGTWPHEVLDRLGRYAKTKVFSSGF